MFSGSIVALVTPLDVSGNVDFSSLENLINYHVNANTSAIVAVGTTGESATLTEKEQFNVVMKCIEFSAGRIPIIVGTGANSTRKAITITESYQNTGVVGCLSVTPYYNKPTQEGLFQHYKAISESTDLPQILYNVPGRTAVDLLPETVGRLSCFDNIIGIKDATADLKRVTMTKELCGEKFIQLSGDDETALEFVKLGGHGTISVTANVAAEEMATLFKFALQGKFKEAELINQSLMSLHQNLFIEANPIPVKWATHRLGLVEYPTIRLPLTELHQSTHSTVERALTDAGLLK